MRLLLLILLFAPCLHALDTKDIDGDTLRDVRIALLKDEVRGHLGLRIGDFESLDQALRVKFDGAHLLCMRLGSKSAGVVIRDAKPGVHLFTEVEGSLTLESFDDTRAVLRCKIEDDATRARLLRLRDGKLELAFTWISAESESLEGGRYRILITRELKQADDTLQLAETTRFELDGNAVEGGQAGRSWTLTDEGANLKRGKLIETPIAVTTHCSIARRLERDGFTEAALRHARLAESRADADKLREDDSRRLEALSLVTRLKARLRKGEVVEK